MEKKNTHIPYAFVTALVMIIIGLVLHLADLSYEAWVQWLSYGIFLVGIITNAVAYSKANDGFVSFGNVFSSGFKASAIITLVMLAWSFISIMIFPEIVERGMEMTRERMENQNMSEEQLEQGMAMSQKYFKLFMTMGIVFGFMVAGALFSLIGAAIAKKKGNQSPQINKPL